MAASGERARRERQIRLGNYETGKIGVRRFDFSDPYRFAVGLSWPRFLGALLAAELAVNVCFALLYLLRPGAVANAHPGSLADAFFFSIETLATVGYGEMYPADLYGHVVSAAEIVVGMAFVAVATGLILARVSRPKPCLVFSERVALTRHDGLDRLVLQVASAGAGVLFDAEARLNVQLPRGADGTGRRDVVPLALSRESLPVLVTAWTLVHVIDAASPLAGLDRDAMLASGLRLFLTVRAEDASLGATIRDFRAYRPDAIAPGMRFVEAVVSGADGHPVLDLGRLGLLEPDAG